MMKDLNMPAAELNNNPDPHKLKVMLTRTHSFINFFDINVNKAVYEAVFILGSNYSNVVLFNVLDLYYYTKERLAKPLDLSDPDYNGKYCDNERYLFSLHEALHAYVLTIEATFASKRESHNTLLVGTHADEFDSISDANVRAGEVYKRIDEYARTIKIEGALAILSAESESSKIIPIANVKDSADYETVMKEFFKIIDRDKQFEEYVPMKFMFLRCMLHSTNKLFITSEELRGYAQACNFSQKEVGDFLTLFSKCCSLFPLNFNMNGEDCGYVILQPDKLIDGLNKLYNNHTDDTSFRKGLLSIERARELWKDNESHDFYTSVLLSAGLMAKVDDNMFFLPSLRLKYDKSKPTTQSNSLIVEFSIRLIPYHKQCVFVSHFKKKTYGDCIISFDSDCSSSWYNVVKFTCKRLGTIYNFAIRFRSEYIEIFIESSEGAPQPPTEIYSCLKRACADVLMIISKDYSGLRYKFGVVCPKSDSDTPHFVTFSLLTTSLHECDQCNTCNTLTVSSSHPAISWIESIFIGDYKAGVLIDGKYLFKYCLCCV